MSRRRRGRHGRRPRGVQQNDSVARAESDQL